MWPTLLLALTLVVFTLPLLPALIEWRRKDDVLPLKIVQTQEGNVFYFADSFRTFIEGELHALAHRRNTHEPSENYALVHEEGLFVPDAKESRSRLINRILIAMRPLHLPDNLSFPREVFARQAVTTGSNNRFRAILAEGTLVLGRNTTVLRWAHGRNVQVGGRANLMGRLSAEESISLEPGCRFSRVHAPTISFGRDPWQQSRAEQAATSTAGKVSRVLKVATDNAGRWLIDGDFTIPAYSAFQGDIIVHGSLRIERGTHISGSIKTHGDLVLVSRCHVKGSMVSGGSIILGPDCTAGGPVVAEQRVDLHPGVVVGTLKKAATITAGEVRAESGVVVHGTVWARERGMTLPYSRKEG